MPIKFHTIYIYISYVLCVFLFLCVYLHLQMTATFESPSCLRKHELAAVFIGHWQGAKEVVKSFSTTHFGFERVEFAYAYTGHTETAIWLRNNILHIYLLKNFGVPFTAPLKRKSHSLLRWAMLRWWLPMIVAAELQNMLQVDDECVAGGEMYGREWFWKATFNFPWKNRSAFHVIWEQKGAHHMM